MAGLKPKTLDEIIAKFGDKLPENVILAIFLEQSGMTKKEIDFYVDSYNAEKAQAKALSTDKANEENIINVTLE